MKLTFVLMLLVVVSTAYDTRYYRGQITVPWAYRRKFCGKLLLDLKQSICPHENENDDIPVQFKNNATGKAMAQDCCSRLGCTPLYLLKNYCINTIRADTTKDLIIYRNGKPVDLSKTSTIEIPRTTTPTAITTTTNTMNITTTESLDSGASINNQPNFKTTTKPSTLTTKIPTTTTTTTTPTAITTTATTLSNIKIPTTTITTNKMDNIPTI